jgi:hypothetical protein
MAFVIAVLAVPRVFDFVDFMSRYSVRVPTANRPAR